MNKISNCFLLFFTCYFVFTVNLSAQTKQHDTNFFSTVLNLNNGKTIKLTDLKNKVILLDFWYRGCLPCLKAIPYLIELQEEFKNDLVIIGINDMDTKNDVNDYYSYKKVNYLSTYKSDTNISKKLKISAFPTTVIINQNGEVVSAESGFQKGTFKKSLRKNIKKLIKENGHS
ncbi:MAG: TlpA disulfide reductase family protein [Flavobacterium nitrogenifigens]|uniref:TlpA family protein disulfide reductase n=1 Tax=Flavobacterium nitrogenifigens TaxID=1617283 RepID=UPI002808E16C|nr:TlpA disulfide reductase family protein [Flavobacterium nitrogenifigens]MDQ8015123.1 TlpA disulfide reductase family protein [Flavobacterium nitrogenifigens]